MSYTVENLEKSMAKITITVSAEDFETAMVRSYNKNKKSEIAFGKEETV